MSAASSPAPTQTLRLRHLSSIHDIDARAWDRLNQAAQGGVLSSHAMLSAFEDSGSVSPATGWQAHHLVIEHDHGIIATIPMYAKSHSYGEFVFDWAWAEAYERHGLKYYPKWLSAVPFTPVTGPKLLCDTKDKHLVAQALLSWAKRSPLSSLHLLFVTPEEQQALVQAGCLAREHVQFHWFNQNWADFEAFLTSLSQSKRKKIRAERRKVQEAGITTRVLYGAQISPADWDFFYTCYSNTYHLRGNTPYLNRAFFTQIAQTLADNCLMVVADDGARPIASALSWLDPQPSGARLYGRYWGCTEHVECLHFEVAYYRAIEWAIAQGIAVIEGGAQGPHKIARGFVPVRTHSAHWLAHPGFYDAIHEYLQEETEHIERYAASLNSPYKTTG